MAKQLNNDILDKFRKEMNLNKAELDRFTEIFQNVFEEALLQDKIVKISGLGAFKLVVVDARKSVDVNTGEEIEIASHYKLNFVPESSLKELVNKPLSHLKIVELGEHGEALKNENASIPESQVLEENADPLQKLTEQAVEIKDILADIQGETVNPEEKESYNTQVSDKKEATSESDTILEKKATAINSEENESVEKNLTESKDETETLVSGASYVTLSSNKTKKENKRDKEVHRKEKIGHKPRKKRRWIWVLLIIILLLGAGGYFAYQYREAITNSVNQLIEKLKTTKEESTTQSDKKVNETKLDGQTLKKDVIADDKKQEEAAIKDSYENKLDKKEVETQVEVKVDNESNEIKEEGFSEIFNRQRKFTKFRCKAVLNEGSRLTWLSSKYYGHKDFWVYIYEANREIIKDPNQILVGTEVRIPEMDKRLIDPSNPECIEYARYLHDLYVRKNK